MKSVLVSFLDRNKVIKLPCESEEGDIPLLKREFRKEFAFEKHVAVDVTFQRYDHDWNEFVDLNDDEKVCNKEKLKVVVTSTLYSPAETDTQDDKSSEAGMPKTTPTGTSGHKSETKTFTGRPIRRLPLLEDEDEDNTDRPSLDANTSDVSLFDSSNSKKRRKVEKCANDSIPLPNPFPLPKHFRRDVEVALETKQLTKETRSQFFSAVASSMLAYKRYPTAEDYRNVSVSICDKYEYMKSPVGSPYGAIIQSLMNRFKEFRREKKPRPVKQESSNNMEVVPSTSSAVKSQSPGQAVVLKKPLPISGEDKMAFMRHNKALIAEFKKNKANVQVVDELMDSSFPMRRQDILDNPYDLVFLFEKYPFLQKERELLMEMQRLCDNNITLKDSQDAWQEIYPMLLQQAKLDAQQSVQLKKLLDYIPDSNDSLLGLVILPMLLPDSRTKADPSKVIYFTKGAMDIEEIVKENQQPQPYLLATGDFERPGQCYLVADCLIIHEVKECPPLSLLAAYFIYNICYPKGCKNMYSFMEVFFLKSPTEKVPLSVKNLYSNMKFY